MGASLEELEYSQEYFCSDSSMTDAATSKHYINLGGGQVVEDGNASGRGSGGGGGFSARREAVKLITFPVNLENVRIRPAGGGGGVLGLGKRN